jgi:hypothetical protein
MSTIVITGSGITACCVGANQRSTEVFTTGHSERPIGTIFEAGRILAPVIGASR